MSVQSNIRNFSIIAHIDHGKSTLADRMIELTGGLSKREMGDQVLDNLDLERERGITIKAQSVCLSYKGDDGLTYMLNMIDTPGHVDFSYEVSRSLAACEGAILLIDISQGVEAQTLANVYLALEQDLEILLALNKADLSSRALQNTRDEIESLIGLDASEALLTSGKTGQGVDELFRAIVKHVPPPSGDANEPLQALIYDAWFDSYLGAMAMVRIVNGSLTQGDKIVFMHSDKQFEVAEIGKFTPRKTKVKQLTVGEVGFISAGIKKISDVRVGDTITLARNRTSTPLAGYAAAKPMVFSGIYPADGEGFENLRDGLEKIGLNDAALAYEPENSGALGLGFRCQFLGLLHMEITQQRLERELGVELITTAPSVRYEVHLKSGELVTVDSPSQLPDPGLIDYIAEPFVRGKVLTPNDFAGNVIKLCIEKRGVQKSLVYVEQRRLMIEFEMPLNEIIIDFYDKLKSATKGYGSFDYEHIGYRRGELVKLEILINNDRADSLALIVPKDQAYYRGRQLASSLKKHIPRQMFDIAIQAAIGSRILARESISALRKNVTAKCYGGDITRKRKLLERQKEGKKRMKRLGMVDVPQEAFMAVLKLK